MFSLLTVFAQKTKQDEVESTPVETKTETKSESSPPPSPPETKSEPPPTSEPPPASEPTRTSETSSDRNDTSGSDSRNSGSSTPTTTAGRNAADRERRRQGQLERKNRNDDDDDDRRGRRRRGGGHYKNCPYYDAYGNCSYYPPSDADYTPSDFSDYFDGDDVAYIAYESFSDDNPDNYQPFFETPLRPEFTPLHKVFLVETTRELPFASPAGWAFYYEPDLDNFFIDFARFEPLKFDRMVITPVGSKTIKKVNKKYGYKGTAVRPLLVEDLFALSSDRLYSFSLEDVPKGTYELKLLTEKGDTVRLQFDIK